MPLAPYPLFLALSMTFDRSQKSLEIVLQVEMVGQLRRGRVVEKINPARFVTVPATSNPFVSEVAVNNLEGLIE